MRHNNTSTVNAGGDLGLFGAFRQDMEMENLMEKIRAKAVENPQRTLMDTSKTVRINMADRKHSLDTVDKGILRKVTYQDLVLVMKYEF